MLIGIVLGGTQALSRSLFSQLVPRSREAEFFGFYQAMERGTCWFGTLLFGLVHQVTDSYRPAIVALVVFFVARRVLLRRVDVRQGIREAGNEVPRGRLTGRDVRTARRRARTHPVRALTPNPSHDGEATEQRHRSGRWTR